MISSNTTQIKLNLPSVLKRQLEEIAGSFGFTVSAYLRHLVLTDVGEKTYPVFEASDEVKKRIRASVSKKAKFVKVDNIDNFFAKL